jgi:hypothetical protein
MLSLQLKQYTNKVLTNVLSSQFVYSSIQEHPQLKKQQLIINSKKRKKTHYLYLFLMTTKRPYAKKYYIGWKSSSQKQNLVQSKPKTVSWHVEIPTNKIFDLLGKILFNIIPTQTDYEKPILNSHQHQLDVIIPYAPLTIHTIGLQSRNSYMTDIPITWRWQWNNISLFQKIFILRHFKVINQPNLKRLEI